MPLPKPSKGMKQDDFMKSCMSELSTEFPDAKQRTAVCMKQFNIKESTEVNLMRDYIHESIEIPVTEVTAEAIASGVIPVRILRPGFNYSKSRNYTKAAVKDTVTLFEGVKQYANHATKSEAQERPERDIRDWVSTLKNIHVTKEGNAVGESHIHAGWFKEMVQNLFDAGTLNKLGVSINAIGKGSKQKIDGVETFVVESLIDHPFKSVDFVTEAGAGGQAGVRESNIPEVVDAYLMDLTRLKEARPDLVNEIESEVIAINEVKNKLEVEKNMELEAQLKEAQTQLEVATKERDELKGKIAEAEKGKARIEAQAIIKEAVGKSTLPDAAKTKLTEQFKDAEKADGIEQAIKAEGEYLAKLTESGKVRGMGASKVNPEVDKKALKESFKNLGMSDKEAEIAVNAR